MAIAVSIGKTFNQEPRPNGKEIGRWNVLSGKDKSFTHKKCAPLNSQKRGATAQNAHINGIWKNRGRHPLEHPRRGLSPYFLYISVVS